MVFLAHEFILHCHHTFGYIWVVLLSCVWLFGDPMDYSLQDSSVHGILQARILEWVAISSSRESSWPRDQTHVSCLAVGFFATELVGSPGYIILVYFQISYFSGVGYQLSSVPQSCPTLCDSTDCSTSGFPLHHQEWDMVLIFVSSFMPSVSFWRNSPWTFWTFLGLNTTTDECPMEKLWLIKREMHNFRV